MVSTCASIMSCLDASRWSRQARRDGTASAGHARRAGQMRRMEHMRVRSQCRGADNVKGGSRAGRGGFVGVSVLVSLMRSHRDRRGWQNSQVYRLTSLSLSVRYPISLESAMQSSLRPSTADRSSLLYMSMNASSYGCEAPKSTSSSCCETVGDG